MNMCTKQHVSIYLCVVRVRLRKKTWKNPGTVFLDYHVYEEDISISSNWEVFLEVLDGNLCFSLSFKHCFTMRFFFGYLNYLTYFSFLLF